jgi:putative ABC transport system permease protein
MRYAFRLLSKSPLFTTVAILTLAIAIGANTAIFTLVDALLLRPLPYRDPDRLVMIWENSKRFGRINMVSAADFADWKARNTVFEDLAYTWENLYTITGAGDPLSVLAHQASANFFPLLGVKPFLGRIFLPGEEFVAVLNYSLWQSHFGADRGIVGRSVTMDGKPYTIIGVMPPEFAPFQRGTLVTPLILKANEWNDRRNHLLRVHARLKPGIDLPEAQAQMSSIAAQLERTYPATNAGWGAQLQMLRETYVKDIRPSLVVLQIAVLFMLLIACANIANLVLTRSSSRDREVAIRLALGSSQGRLFRQFLTEGLLLAIPGASLGILLAWWSVRAFPALLPASLAEVYLPARALPAINAPVLLFTLAASLVAAILFGLVPAFRKPALAGRNATAGKEKGRLRNALVVAQIALSLVLLVGAGLMIRSLAKLHSRDFGFRTDRILTMFLAMPPNRYAGAQRTTSFVQEVIARTSAIHGVESVAGANTVPLGANYNRRGFSIPGLPAPAPGEENNAEFRLVTPDYFRTMGIRLLKGRFFNANDRLGTASVAMISESMAKRFWPSEDPIGKRVIVPDGIKPEPREIVGVVGDTLSHGLASDVQLEIYRPFYQSGWPFFQLIVHTSQDPLTVAGAIQKAIWSIDPEEPIRGSATMEQLAQDSLVSRRIMVNLLTGFSTLALFLACLGIYGVIAYAVKQRTAEIGIRMALGATSGRVLSSVLGLGLRLALIGVIVGGVCALAVTRFLQSLLFGVSAADPRTFIAVSALMFAVAVVAALVPAQRAAKIDPMEALRYE